MFANHFNIPACLEIVGVVGVEPLGQPVPAISAKDVGLDMTEECNTRKRGNTLKMSETIFSHEIVS